VNDFSSFSRPTSLENRHSRGTLAAAREELLGAAADDPLRVLAAIDGSFLRALLRAGQGGQGKEEGDDHALVVVLEHRSVLSIKSFDRLQASGVQLIYVAATLPCDQSAL
jgi:hypothetical protein